MLKGVHRTLGPEAVIYGEAAAEAVRRLAEDYGARRLLVTTTASLSGPGALAETLANRLDGLAVGVFGAISAHSPRSAVIAGAAAARRSQADLLVALGGGSVIDATKAMQIALWAGLTRAEDLDAFRAGAGEAARLAPGVRMIALPTTLSAAEFTPFAGITDATAGRKEGFGHPALVPRAVILDPALTGSTPQRLWLSTGMKAIDHAVEQLCGATRSPYADALAEAGLKALAAALPASRKPGDLEARQACQIGAWLAMSGAIAGRGLGASHAIGHTLGGSFAVPHGVTSCVALPAVLRWNAEANPERQALVATLLGAAGKPAGDAVEAFARALGLPTRLSEIGVAPADFARIAEITMHDRGVRANPRPIAGPSDIAQILQLAA